ncbi:MAG: polysaccharide biosynthesis protein, partial [Dolichospermum sp.]
MSSRFDKLFYWFKLLSKFVSVQLIVQALGFASGIIIIRTLNKTEYSYFLIANAMQSTMDLMADFGITIGLNSIGGRIWQDRSKLGELVNTAFSVRYSLIVISVLTITPVLLWLLIDKGASWWYSTLIVLAIVIELYFYTKNKILGAILRLKSQIKEIQTLDLILASSRLIGLGFTYFIGLNAVISLFCSTIASSVQNYFLHLSSEKSFEKNSPINLDYQSEIWKLIKSQFFPTTFFCFQGQITILLISLFGKTSSIAEIGALSRLGIIITIFNPVVSSILVPMYARCQSIDTLKRRYWQFLVGFASMSICLLFAVYLFTEQILWVLGNQYSSLKSDLIFVMVASVIYSLNSLTWSLNYAKGWVKESYLTILTTILTQIFLLLILDISTVRGLILFGLYSSI